MREQRDMDVIECRFGPCKIIFETTDSNTNITKMFLGEIKFLKKASWDCLEQTMRTRILLLNPLEIAT